MSAHGDFISRIRAAVREYNPAFPKSVVDLVVAFFAHETGFGTMGPYAKFGHFNLGNITRTENDPRPVDFEENGDYRLGPNGAHIPVNQRWAVFDSDVAGVAGWFEFISTPRYAQATAQLKAGNEIFASTLGPLGYYGETVDHYLHGVPGHAWDKGFLGALAEVKAEPENSAPVSEKGSAGVYVALAAGVLALGAILMYFLLT